MSTLKKLMQLEAQKYRDRGIFSILSLFLLYSYFVYLPPTVLWIYQKLPAFTLYQLYAFGSPLVHHLVFILIHSFFGVLYWVENPTIESWKVDKSPWPWKSDPVFSEKIARALKSTIINQMVIALPASIIMGFKANYLIKPEEFPSLSVNFYQILVCILAEDFMFYIHHRAFHHPKLYKLIHKQHHEFNVTVSLASEHAHPVEFLVGNLGPIAAGPFILGGGKMHILTWYMWVSFRILHTAEGHSGYHLPFSPFRFLPFGVSTKYHDDHHLKNVGNYCSMLVIWDTIFGSNQDIKEKSL